MSRGGTDRRRRRRRGRCRRRRRGRGHRPPAPRDRSARRRRHPVRQPAVDADHRVAEDGVAAARRGRRARAARRRRHRPSVGVARTRGRRRSPWCSRTATRSTWTAGTSSARPTAGWCARCSTTSARTAARAARARSNATIDQLGLDLLAVLDAVAPDGPVVVVGHSMGGMTIVALAEQHPELFGDRIVGVGLISTTAGGLEPSKILLPMIPAKLTGGITQPRGPHPGPRAPHRRRPAPGRPRGGDGGHRPVRVRRRGAGGVRRLRRRDALGHAVRGRRRLLPELPLARQVRLRRGDVAGADHGHLRHRRQDHLDRPQPQAARADRRLDAAGVRGRRAHGDPRAARPGQRRPRPADLGGRGAGRRPGELGRLVPVGAPRPPRTCSPSSRRRSGPGRCSTRRPTRRARRVETIRAPARGPRRAARRARRRAGRRAGLR